MDDVNVVNCNLLLGRHIMFLRVMYIVWNLELQFSYFGVLTVSCHMNIPVYFSILLTWGICVFPSLWAIMTSGPGNTLGDASRASLYDPSLV